MKRTALALALMTTPAAAQTQFYPPIGSAPVAGMVQMCLNSAGQAVPVSNGTCASGGAAPAAYIGTDEQDVAATRTLDATSLASQQTYIINGQATLSFAISGLTASGATVSFLQSNDWNGTTGTFTPVSEVNTGTGIASLTRSTDGQSAIGVEGSKALRIQVTTVGTGTITLATNISVRSRLTALRAPLPPGTNAIGSTVPAPSPLATVANAPVSVQGATSNLVKASAGNLYGFSLTEGTAAGFFALLDLAAVPAAGAAIAPKECVPVPANGFVARRQDVPDRYLNGIVIVSTSNCATYTAVTPQVITGVAQ